jgi:PAS domain-containing protein
MFDVGTFALTDMIKLGAALRGLGERAGSMEEVADRIVRHLFGCLVRKETGEKACVLVRAFKTHAYGGLGPELRSFADSISRGNALAPQTKCLVLLGTAGEKPEWNERQKSAGHQAIPLPTPEALERSPMISELISSLGFNLRTLVESGDKLLLEEEQTDFNVFHVPEAEGSPYVPAQKEFVIPFGVKSVLGFGGLMPPNDLFAVILFARMPIPRETAERFKTLALSAKLAMVPFADRVSKRREPGRCALKQDDGGLEAKYERLKHEHAALRRLFEVYERTTLEQATKLEELLEGQRRAQEELRSSSELNRLLLESAPEAIYGLDTRGEITFCNPAGIELLGYEAPAELLGKNAHKLLHHSRPDGSPYPPEDCPMSRSVRPGAAESSGEEYLWRRQLVDGHFERMRVFFERFNRRHGVTVFNARGVAPDQSGALLHITLTEFFASRSSWSRLPMNMARRLQL